MDSFANSWLWFILAPNGPCGLRKRLTKIRVIRIAIPTRISTATTPTPVIISICVVPMEFNTDLHRRSVHVHPKENSRKACRFTNRVLHRDQMAAATRGRDAVTYAFHPKIPLQCSHESKLA